MEDSHIVSGQRIMVKYENREFDVIVIDPEGLGNGRPSIGVGFRMIEKYSGIPQPTLSRWIHEGDAEQNSKQLKLASGKVLRVMQIKGTDNNTYFVIEVADWVAMVGDLLKHPGKLSQSTKNKLIDFLTWFATKGLYAEAYTQIKGKYNKRDSEALTDYLNERLVGIKPRNEYTDFLQSVGVQGIEFAIWTNRVYLALFGMDANEMKQVWTEQVCISGKGVARNYIPETIGLKAVAYVEKMVREMYCQGDDLKELHERVCALAIRKFQLNYRL